jgi:hypothetical protein
MGNFPFVSSFLLVYQIQKVGVEREKKEWDIHYLYERKWFQGNKELVLSHLVTPAICAYSMHIVLLSVLILSLFPNSGSSAFDFGLISMSLSFKEEAGHTHIHLYTYTHGCQVSGWWSETKFLGSIFYS